MQGEINSKTKLYGLIGNPVGHSMSPLIHNYLFTTHQLNCVYLTFDVKEGRLGDAIKGIKALGVRGVNVTSPYKTEVMKYLDWVSDRAVSLNSVNTIKNINGKLYGFNTDYFGLIKTFRSNNIDVEGMRVLLIGAGAVGNMLLHILEDMKARDVIILNRTASKKKLLKMANKKRNFCKFEELNSRNINIELGNVDILINSTSVDLLVDTELEINLQNARKDTVFFDIKYNPETQLISRTRELGFKAISGREMLIWQAIKSFYIWTGIYFEEDNKVFGYLYNRLKRTEKNSLYKK